MAQALEIRDRILRLERVKAKDLKPHVLNPRLHPAHQVSALRVSLERIGYADCLIAYETPEGLRLIDGHARRDLTPETAVPVIVTDLSEEEAAMMLAIGDPLSALAERDDAVMAELLQQTNQDVLAELLAGNDALAELLGRGEEVPADGLLPGADADAIPEHAPTRCKAGDLWALGAHRLFVGDCTNPQHVERVVGGGKTHAVVTDPPYGIGRDGITNDDPEGLRDLFIGALSCSPCKSGAVVAFQSPRLFTVWLDVARELGHAFERMLWMYKPADCTFPWRGWLLTSEAILVTRIGEAHWNEVHPFAHDCYSPTTVGRELPEGTGWHASVKPLAVVADLLQRVTQAGQAVYDPFLGSGTTLVAAQQVGRSCVGLEIEPGYCDVILARWEQATGKSAERLEVG